MPGSIRTIEGAGSATGLSGTPAFDLKGMFSPDWQALTDLLARKVEPNASISGGPRQWRLSGKVPSQGGGDVIGDRFLAREIARTLAGDERRQLVVGEPAPLGGDDMGVELVG